MMSKVARFQELYNVACNDEESLIVPIYAEMVAIAKDINLGYFRMMKCTQVGVHWKNRDQAVCSGREALTLWDEVDKVGVAPDLWRDATAIEEHGDRMSETKFFQICDNDPHLRKFEFGEIEASAIACSHWNQAVAAALANVVSRPELNKLCIFTHIAYT
jgi:hypothetical protein